MSGLAVEVIRPALFLRQRLTTMMVDLVAACTLGEWFVAVVFYFSPKAFADDFCSCPFKIMNFMSVPSYGRLLL